MTDESQPVDLADEMTDESASALNSGNLLFGFLGAWCACVVCLMVYSMGDDLDGSPDENRAPAEAAPAPAPSKDGIDPSAYLLSFNSIHLEK